MTRISGWFWGAIPCEERKKFGLLALIFFCIIGTYWLLRPLKESIFFHTVGSDWQPTVKKITILFVFVLAAVYSKLIDLVHRETMFYIIGLVYSATFLAIIYGLQHPQWGLANPALGPERLIGWISYIAIESFGYLMAAHFWGFVSSITLPESAKKGYPFIVACAQAGAILGSLWAAHAHHLRVDWLLFGALGSIIAMMCIVRLFMKEVPREEWQHPASAPKKVEKTGFFEGLWLLVSRPYLLGIFAMVLMFDIVNSIVDFQMLKQASLVPQYATLGGLTALAGWFGILSNSVSFIFALFGTGFVMERFGLVFCLLAFPVSLGIVIALFYIATTWFAMSASVLLWGLVGTLVVTKALNYALNNPAKEMLYIPTSKDAKFKAKSWIDVFGSRSAKAVGAQVNSMLLGAGDVFFFLQAGSLVALGAIVIWVFAALFVGRSFQKLSASGEIIS